MSLSTLATFDDLRRCQNILSDGLAEEEFLRFVQLQEECRLQWLVSVQESRRLQRELDATIQNMADIETKLFHARRMLEMENRLRKIAENEKSEMEKKMTAVWEILRNERDIRDETKDKIAFLNPLPPKRKSAGRRSHDKANEINSTGSILSDLSLTQSEEDFIDIRPSKTLKKHRPSIPSQPGIYVCGRKMRKSGDTKNTSASGSHAQNHVEIGASDKIVAKTKVTVPPEGSGPIVAESTIQAIPQNISPQRKVAQNQQNLGRNEDENREHLMKSPTRRRSPLRNNNNTQFTASAPPLSDFNTLRNTPTNHNFQKKSLMRSHNFHAKTFIIAESCSNCQKKIRFGSLGLKCRDCRVIVHTDCKDQLSIACIPQSSHTPTTKGFMGVVGDYAPSIGPMVPGLIVHCVNEIETRGLDEEGLYRLSRVDRDVKALKERFLRNKGIPFLGNIDVHILANCVKDFLRSLHEPIIPPNLWKDFSTASQNTSDELSKSDLVKAVNRLPQPNRDTLAFLIQHFQRIVCIPEIKMPIGNLARVFAPTIVGYSSPEPTQSEAYMETNIIISVMEKLMEIPTDYWSQFVNLEQNHKIFDPEKDDDTFLGRTYYGTPLQNTIRKDKSRKFYATPPYNIKKN